MCFVTRYVMLIETDHMLMSPPVNVATPEMPVGFGFYYMIGTDPKLQVTRVQTLPNMFYTSRTLVSSCLIRVAHLSHTCLILVSYVSQTCLKLVSNLSYACLAARMREVPRPFDQSKACCPEIEHRAKLVLHGRKRELHGLLRWSELNSESQPV